MDNIFSNIVNTTHDSLPSSGIIIFVIFLLSYVGVKILEKKLEKQILDGIVDKIPLAVIFIVIVVSAILYFLIPKPDFEPLLIVLVAVFSVLCGVILLLRLFLTPFGFNDIKDLTKFARELGILKRADVQKSLAELKDIPKFAQGLEILKSADVKKSLLDLNKLSEVTKTLRENMGSFIESDYSKYCKQLEDTGLIRQVWVLGSSLGYTKKNPQTFLDNLKKGVCYRFLCNVNKKTVSDNAKNIVKEMPLYLNSVINDKDKVVISITKQPHLIKIDVTIFIMDDDKDEVLMFPFAGLENKMGKQYILLKDETSVKTYKEKFNDLWNAENEYTLEDLSKDE